MEALLANLPLVLLILVCPLMMLFMGHGHGGHGHDHTQHHLDDRGAPPVDASKDEITTRPAP